LNLTNCYQPYQFNYKRNYVNIDSIKVFNDLPRTVILKSSVEDTNIIKLDESMPTIKRFKTLLNIAYIFSRPHTIKVIFFNSDE
jgi:hypothetical protein